MYEHIPANRCLKKGDFDGVKRALENAPYTMGEYLEWKLEAKKITKAQALKAAIELLKI